MTLETIGEREMDRLCWILVSTRNRFYPPDETAEECSDTPHDEGYHTGMFVAHDEMMEQLYYYGINVLDRANRYTHINRQHDMEFRLESKPDFYQSIEHGAENTKWLDDIEIEGIDRENALYVPAGAERDE